MSRSQLPPEANPQQRLREWLEFYDELGLAPFVRRPREPAESFSPPRSPEAIVATPALAGTGRAEVKAAPAASPPVPLVPAAPTLSLFGEAPDRHEGESLEEVRADLGDCQRCQLAPHRKHLVFGEGNPRAPLVFVGEGPGAEEDLQGLPFVGRAGQLLNQWIEVLGLKREEVYICNVIKCRPPANRTPEREEIETCSPFLVRQLDAIRPRLICCLGSVALQTLLGKPVAITRLRGQFFDYRGTKLFATFHPAYILRNPYADREVRQDLRTIRQFLRE